MGSINLGGTAYAESYIEGSWPSAVPAGPWSFAVWIRVEGPDASTATGYLSAMLGDYNTTTVPVLCLRVGGDESRIRIPKPMMANLVLSVEKDELGIAAGLQDRVAQVYQGLVYMDFDKSIIVEGTPSAPTGTGTVWRRYFGSSHAGGLNSTFADGSVRFSSFNVDPMVWMYQCVIDDGQIINTDE
jgi:prepilin-type processing-associated H-X9-DG protein